MSETTSIKRKDNELVQLADFAIEIVEGIAQSKGLSERVKETIKKAIESWQKDPQNYEKELDELKKQLPTTAKDISQEEIQSLGDFVFKLLEAQGKLLSVAGDGEKIGQFVALVQQKDNIIELLKNNQDKLQTIKKLFKDSSLSKIPIFGIFDNINYTFKLIKNINDPKVLDYLTKQTKEGKEIGITWLSRAVVNIHKERLQADPKNISTIINAFQAFATYYPLLIVFSPVESVSLKLSDAYEKYIAPVFKDSKIGLYSHLAAIRIAKILLSSVKLLPKNIQTKLSELSNEEKRAKQIAMLDQEEKKTLQALRGQKDIER